MTQVIVNLGYALGLIALTVKDVLWLRSILMLSQLSLFSYALLMGNTNVAFWNILFFAINSIQVARLVRERRPLAIPAELQDLYTHVFRDMTPREFLYFWNTGHIDEVQDQILIQTGERMENISLILSGCVSVIKNNAVIAELTRGSFLAEMSFLTGEPASADVKANGTVRYICWEQEKLRGLKQLNPVLLIKIQNVLGKDLAGKVKASSPGS
jgi:hypothetical protein